MDAPRPHPPSLNFESAFESLKGFNDPKSSIVVENGSFRVIPKNLPPDGAHIVTVEELRSVIKLATELFEAKEIYSIEYNEIKNGARKFIEANGHEYEAITSLFVQAVPPKGELPVIVEAKDNLAVEPIARVPEPSDDRSIDFTESMEGEENIPQEVVAASTATSILRSIWNLPGNMVNGVGSYLYSFFVNDNEIKQKKYQLSLNKMIEGYNQGYPDQPVERILEDLTKVNPQARTELQSKLLKTLQILIPEDSKKYAITLNGKPAINYRKQHREFLIAFREVINSNEYANAIKKIERGEELPEATMSLMRAVLGLAESRYLDTHMYSYVESIVENIINTGNEEIATKHKQPQPSPTSISLAKNLSESNLPEVGKEENPAKKFSESFDANTKAIKHKDETLAVPKLPGMFNKAKAHANVDFDPAKMTNIPYVHFDLPITESANGQPRNVRFIRMGSPTIDPNPTEAIVSPEFKAFLMKKKLMGENHFYVSLQMPWEHEANRTKALIELQKEFSNFKIVVLTQDSDFYKQQKEFAIENEPFEKFKGTFMDQMFNQPLDDSGYYIPDEWKKDETFKVEVESIMDDARYLLFPDKENLSIQDKKDLIEISYALLTLYMLRKSNANTANITCKDAIDRAAKNSVLLTKVVLGMAGQAKNKQYDSMFETFTHGPSFLVRKNIMEPKRAARLKGAGDALGNVGVDSRLVKLAEARGKLYGLPSDPKRAIPTVRTDDSQRVSVKAMKENVRPVAPPKTQAKQTWTQWFWGIKSSEVPTVNPPGSKPVEAPEERVRVPAEQVQAPAAQAQAQAPQAPTQTWGSWIRSGFRRVPPP